MVTVMLPTTSGTYSVTRGPPGALTPTRSSVSTPRPSKIRCVIRLVPSTAVTGRFKTSHLWALQNQPGAREVVHPSVPIIPSVWGPYSHYHPPRPNLPPTPELSLAGLFPGNRERLAGG